ncbi:MAG: DUF5333 domain-containing protein [Pseudomonadota bacterium]
MSLILASALVASSAAAKPHLRDTPIDDAILSMGLADQIRKECPDISARMVKALRAAHGLKDQALALGYSEAEIDAYRKSATEKARLRAAGEARLAAEGVTPGDAQSYCAFGRREIEQQTPIGVLLRAS